MRRISVIVLVIALLTGSAYGATIESHYNTPWIGQADTIYTYGADYRAERLGNSHGHITAYPTATFATIGFDEVAIMDSLISSEYGSYDNFLPIDAIASGIPPFLFLPGGSTPSIPVPEPKPLSLPIFIVSALFLIIHRARTRMCKKD